MLNNDEGVKEFSSLQCDGYSQHITLCHGM